MHRCRICDNEYINSLNILDDDLCEECEEAVLDAIADFRTEEEKDAEETEQLSTDVPNHQVD